MSANTESRMRRVVRRVAEIWNELDYAQHRLVELQTGEPDLER